MDHGAQPLSELSSPSPSHIPPSPSPSHLPRLQGRSGLFIGLGLKTSMQGVRQGPKLVDLRDSLPGIGRRADGLVAPSGRKGDWRSVRQKKQKQTQ